MSEYSETDALLSDIEGRITTLVETAREEGREEALEDLRKLVGGLESEPAPATRKRATRKKRKKRRNEWDTYTPAQRLERINKLRAGRGLPPRTELPPPRR